MFKFNDKDSRKGSLIMVFLLFTLDTCPTAILLILNREMFAGKEPSFQWKHEIRSVS